MENSELYHHGILGQKRGVRRFQNEDGSLTEAGKIRYYGSVRKYNKARRRFNKNHKDSGEDFVKSTLFDWDNMSKEMQEAYFGSTKRAEKALKRLLKDVENDRITIDNANEGGKKKNKDNNQKKDKDKDKKDNKDNKDNQNENKKDNKQNQQKNLSNYAEATDAVGKFVKAGSQSVGKSVDINREKNRIIKANEEAKQLTIKELEARTARLNLEEKYITAREKDLKRGQVAVEKTLDNIGDYATLASAGINLAVTLGKLSKKK